MLYRGGSSATKGTPGPVSIINIAAALTTGMHEFIYADRILQSVLEEIARGVRVREVQVEVGELLDLSDESLNMAYGILSKDTAASGSRLRVKLVRSSAACPNCGYSGEAGLQKGMHAVDPVFACPKCSAPLKVASGNELKITGVV